MAAFARLLACDRASADRNRTTARLLAPATVAALLHTDRQWQVWTWLWDHRSSQWYSPHRWVWRRYCPGSLIHDNECGSTSKMTLEQGANLLYFPWFLCS